MSNVDALPVPVHGPTRPRTPAPRPVKRERRTQAERSDETRQRVVEAAASVLRRKGYAGLRTHEVARVARVSRGAMQYHFRTKDSLVLATAEHLLQASFERGRARAAAAQATDAVGALDTIIEDCVEFFLGPDFAVILDLVLAGTKDRNLRDTVYGHARRTRLGVEAAWLDLLCARGLPRPKAEKLLWLTISIVRGFSVRALWQRDAAWFRELIAEWKVIVAPHLERSRP